MKPPSARIMVQGRKGVNILSKSCSVADLVKAVNNIERQIPLIMLFVYLLVFIVMLVAALRVMYWGFLAIKTGHTRRNLMWGPTMHDYKGKVATLIGTVFVLESIIGIVVAIYGITIVFQDILL